ncbi:DegV family protein [Enterococcus alishanensis]|uniref:DegV family protein n=1 Tax=Enterococcus alishanensis TaxID=1303817 RepID=A0ABS6TAV0_9ENTE|nr:DegV family protein [Enterococcus alishanensis]MBV7390023.1 DegV family protein [Enterococcus alishanensis]
MSKVKIVTDSSCTIEKSVRDDLNITMIPLSVMIDDVVYPDDDNLSGEKFMDMMAGAKSLPKTSQPPIGYFAELYDELGKDGSQIISIHMVHTLSGTVEAARQATFLTSSDVTVIDSGFIDQGLSFQVIRAAEMANNGASVEEILAAIGKIKENSYLFIGISSLDNLVKGGRVSRAKGVISNVLNMRVIMELENGLLTPIVKGRGKKTFTKWFENFKDELSKFTIRKIGISHTGKTEFIEEAKQALQEMFPDMEIPVLHTNPIVATHAGKEAFAIMYYTE